MDFSRKKKKKAKDTRSRMEVIMSAKSKVLEFAHDVGDLSACETELSELDSDVRSLGSIRSCAESWILESDYKKPAQEWVKIGLQMSAVRA